MIEKVKITEVIRNASNPRTIKNDKREKLIKSIKEFPEMLKIRPIVVDENNIILGGNMRYDACKSAGLKEIWIIKANNLTEEQKKEFVVKDNVGYGEWDWDILSNEYHIDELEDWGLEMPEYLQAQPGDEEDVDEDNFKLEDDLQIDIKIGDVITFHVEGEEVHRLVCGDSLVKEHIELLMGEDRADLIYTDPPYGISYTGANNPTAKVWDMIENDELTGDNLEQFIESAFKLASEYSKKDVAAYCWYANSNYAQFRGGVNKAGWTIKQDLIWNKGMTLGRADYHWAHEPCLYLKKTNQRTEWYGDRTNKTIIREKRIDVERLSKEELQKIIRILMQDSTNWEINKDSAMTYIHPTQKPIQLAARAIRNSSPLDGIVLDMFTGSGSSLLACHATGRRFRGMELDTKYAQLITDRMAQYDTNITIKINGKDYGNGE